MTWIEVVQAGGAASIGGAVALLLRQAAHSMRARSERYVADGEMAAGVLLEMRQMLADSRDDVARLEARVDALVDAHPYDPRAAMRDAILCAVRWKFRDESAKDLYRRQLKEHHNAVQELQMQFVDLVRRPGDARQAATELRRANDPLATALPELDDILDTWVTSIELAFMRINPRFFVCGGITLNLYSVPRGARDWVVGQGLRAVHHHWGLGELPEIVLEHLTAGQRPNDKQVSVTMLNNEHCTMAVDQWEIANALWSEHRNMRRGEVPYADPAEALRAARSL
jgi:hypothetical protein